MMTANAFALYWFIMFPAACLCLQYGVDLIAEEFTPIHVEE